MEATTSKWQPIFTFFKNFTYNFFVYCQIVANFILIHATSFTKTLHLLSAPFLFSTADAEQISPKMTNGNHLEAAGFIQKAKPYLDSVKKIGSGKHFQVSGYFLSRTKVSFVNRGQYPDSNPGRWIHSQALYQ